MQSASASPVHNPVLLPAWLHQGCALQRNELIRQLLTNCSRFWIRAGLTDANMTQMEMPVAQDGDSPATALPMGRRMGDKSQNCLDT